MATSLDIDAAVAAAEAETGIVSQGGRIRVAGGVKPTKSRAWAAEEDAFLVANRGRLSEREIARRLGRTQCAVHLHAERYLHLRAPSKDASILTAEHIAWGLGCDSKSIHALMDRGLMPGRRLPTARVIRVVDRLALLRWISDPMHWIYFQPERVGEMIARGTRPLPAGGFDIAFWEQARAVVLAARRKWKDAWLTPGQVMRMLKIRGGRRQYLNKAIHRGVFPRAVKYYNWCILRSELPPAGYTIGYSGCVVKRDRVVKRGRQRLHSIGVSSKVTG